MAVPKISCLVVTANRLVLLKEAIACYLAQTYPNRELIIVSAGDPRYRAAIEDYIRSLGRHDIWFTPIDDPSASLGILRNASIEAARGEFICQWDDDDLYHPTRLEKQYAEMCRQNAGACFLTDHLQYFMHDRSMFWIDWTHFGGTIEKQLLPGSMLAINHPQLRYPETGPSACWGEDNAIRSTVCRIASIAPLSGHGYLYVYRCHGRNTMPDRHHQSITALAGANAAFIRAHESELRRALPAYRVPMPYAVKGRDLDVVFTYGEPRV